MTLAELRANAREEGIAYLSDESFIAGLKAWMPSETPPDDEVVVSTVVRRLNADALKQDPPHG